MPRKINAKSKQYLYIYWYFISKQVNEQRRPACPQGVSGIVILYCLLLLVKANWIFRPHQVRPMKEAKTMSKVPNIARDSRTFFPCSGISLLFVLLLPHFSAILGTDVLDCHWGIRLHFIAKVQGIKYDVKAGVFPKGLGQYRHDIFLSPPPPLLTTDKAAHGYKCNVTADKMAVLSYLSVLKAPFHMYWWIWIRKQHSEASMKDTFAVSKFLSKKF